jgi:chemotaxis protein CheX
MDVKFINPFLQGTMEVLKKMTFTEPRPGKVYLKEDNLASGDVSGIIGITGDAVGSLAISFSESCICHVVNRMLGESYTAANQEVFDAVGEITNMISGVARTYMEKDGMKVFAAIPSVVFGKDHTINHILDTPSIVIPFSTDGGEFVVDVCIRTATPGKRTAGQYQVLNRKTLTDAGIPVMDDDPPQQQEPPVKMDRKELLQKQLKEMMATRDAMVKQLTEEPFMQMSKRTLLKKRIPFFDAKIRRLKLDIAAADMIAKISPEDLANPKLVKHYQHYDDKKRKP